MSFFNAESDQRSRGRKKKEGDSLDSSLIDSELRKVCICSMLT